MKKLHLHIGSPKTGTTSIQNTFHTNRSALKKQNVHYPGLMDNHHFSFFATGAEKEDWPRQFNSYDDKTLGQVKNQYFNSLENGLKANIKNHVISTEYLFLSNSEYIQKYISYLDNFFDQIKVYLFLRDPVDYFRSIQQQMIKGRSYISSPQDWEVDFRNIIEAWSEFAAVRVMKYERGIDSCKVMCDEIGIDYDNLDRPSHQSNKSLSIEQMLLLEKVQYQLYQKHEDHFKNHLGVIQNVKPDFTNKPKLRKWVRSIIYDNYHDDMEWLKAEYGIDFLNEELEKQEVPSSPTFENGKARVRDVYKVPSEETVEKYEALVVDALLKKLVQGN